jgi:hypothetical protein
MFFSASHLVPRILDEEADATRGKRLEQHEFAFCSILCLQHQLLQLFCHVSHDFFSSRLSVPAAQTIMCRKE